MMSDQGLHYLLRPICLNSKAIAVASRKSRI